MPKVTIIMPAYNVEKYIRECMDSVIAQTLDDIEIIVVDDGSTDSTGSILDGYAAADKRVRVIHKENSGYGASMNVGLKEAGGEYIGIIETDDFAESRMFEILYDAAVRYEADVVKSIHYNYYTDREPHDRTVDKLSDVHEFNVPFAPVEHPRIFKIPPSIWSGIYRRKMITDNDISFLETPGASYQDTAFAFKVWACAEKVVFINEPMLHYRQDNMGSSVNNERKPFCVCDEFGEIERFLNSDPALKEKFERIMNTAKFGVYMWNYKRLGLEYKYAFLLRMKEELLVADKASKLDRDSLSERQNARLDDLLYNYSTEEYFDQARREILGDYRGVSELVREHKKLKRKTEPPVRKVKRVAAAGMRRIRKMKDR